MTTRNGSVLALLLGASSLFGAAGCSTEATDGPVSQPSEDDVVGVTDLTGLESAFGLVKDTKTNGVYSRGDALLTNGPCYQAHLGKGAPDAKEWQFRRYTEGAAFFRKLGTAPATGDERPVACVDLDSGEGTLSVEGFGLDAALRYGLGRLQGSDGAMGHLYLSFAHGNIEVRDAEHHCGFYDLSTSEPSGDPSWQAGHDAFAKCKSGGGADDACNTNAYDACKTAFAADTAPNSIDHPKLGGDLVLGFDFADLQPQIAMFAYRYALKKGTESDRFSMSRDPVGKYVSFEAVSELSTVTHYEHLDVYHSMEKAGGEAILIAPKGSEKTAEASAIASCHRSVADTGVPTGPFTCKGL